MHEEAERQNIDVRTLAILAVATPLALFAVTGSLALMLPALIYKPPAIAAVFPAPSVLADERAQRIALERSQRARLAGTSGGMPIEQAMQKIIERDAQAYEPVIGMAPP